MFHRYGIRSVTMDDIASELGISKKTLYLNFKNKEELVGEVVDFFIKNPDYHLNSSKSGNPIDHMFALRKHIADILVTYNNHLDFDLKKQYPALFKKVKEFKQARIYTDTVQSLEEGKKQGLFRKEIDSEFIAKLQVGRILYTLNSEQGIFTEKELNNISWFDKTLDYHIYGICTENGLKYYKELLNNLQDEKQN